jgi:hypothetical protein
MRRPVYGESMRHHRSLETSPFTRRLNWYARILLYQIAPRRMFAYNKSLLVRRCPCLQFHWCYDVGHFATSYIFCFWICRFDDHLCSVHNERFLIDSSHPERAHIKSYKWYLLPHGIFGARALLGVHRRQSSAGNVSVTAAKSICNPWRSMPSGRESPR